MTPEQIRNEINDHYNAIKALNKELTEIEMQNNGFIKVNEDQISDLLKTGSIYKLGSETQSNFILLRENRITEVSVYSDNDWTQIIIRPFRFDYKVHSYIRKVNESDLIKLLSSLSQSDFKEL